MPGRQRLRLLLPGPRGARLLRGRHRRGGRRLHRRRLRPHPEPRRGEGLGRAGSPKKKSSPEFACIARGPILHSGLLTRFLLIMEKHKSSPDAVPLCAAACPRVPPRSPRAAPPRTSRARRGAAPTTSCSSTGSTPRSSSSSTSRRAAPKKMKTLRSNYLRSRLLQTLLQQ